MQIPLRSLPTVIARFRSAVGRQRAPQSLCAIGGAPAEYEDDWVPEVEPAMITTQTAQPPLGSVLTFYKRVLPSPPATAFASEAGKRATHSKPGSVNV
jgi:hypothetical protein